MKKVTFILALMLTASVTFAQEAEETAPTSTPLEISGSGDLYYKYDFSKTPNIGTSFATDPTILKSVAPKLRLCISLYTEKTKQHGKK